MCSCLGSIELAFIVQRGLREKLWLPRPPQTPWTMDASHLTDTACRGGSDAASPAVSMFQSSERLETALGQRVMNVAKEWAAAWLAVHAPG